MKPPPNLPFQPGDVLAGKYRVERVLGAGGMGVVVAAHHLHLDEWVAIKILQAGAMSDSAAVTRFLREGRAAAKIQNEHVARVRDVGTLDDGAPYIVMEYLHGSDLDALVKARGPLPIASAVTYMLEACEAFAEAHSLGIVHRDIKPSNLFLAERRDGSTTTKVIDFGISKVTTGVDAGMDITKTAEMRGSLLFISPEQMSSPKNVDPRSDIWSLGVTLHFLLSGKYPFKATSVPEMCAMILQHPPAPLRQDAPSMPEALEAVILRCLQKNPAARFANVADFAEALLPFAPQAAGSAEKIRRLIGGTRSSANPVQYLSKSIGLSAQTAGKSWASTKGTAEGNTNRMQIVWAVMLGVLTAISLAAAVLWLFLRDKPTHVSEPVSQAVISSNPVELPSAQPSVQPVEAAPPPAQSALTPSVVPRSTPTSILSSASAPAASLKAPALPIPKPSVSITAKPAPPAPTKKKEVEIF